MEETENFSTSKGGKEPRSFRQAYSQAPWRKQLQWIAGFLLGLVIIALIAGIYLNVTAQAATAGRKIQELQIRMAGYYRIDLIALSQEEREEKTASAVEPEVVPIEELQMQIADLNAKLAYLESTTRLYERALQLGFIPAQPETMHYLRVPGYRGRQTVQLAPPPSPVQASSTVLAPAYKESLIEWLRRQWILTSRSLKQEAQP